MKKKGMIVQTPVRFYPEIGGVENHVYYLSKELVKNGYNVEVICAGDISLPTKNDGITTKRLFSFFKITNTNITLSLPLVLFKSSFDIIHTHMPTPWTADWSVYIAKIKRKKSVITIHNDLQKNGLFAKLITDIYLATVFRLTLNLVDKIIIVNPDWEVSFPYTKNLLKKFQKKIIVIPNGVDTDIFVPKKKNKELSLLFVSVLDKYHIFKGFDYLLSAMLFITKKIPHIRLHVIGEGELKNHYQKLAQKMGLTEQIIFHGEKSQEQLPEYYNTASVFVLPSIHTEGYGIVLLEALACKTPVVATDIAGVTEDIKKYSAGVIVKPKDTKALAEAIISLLKSATLRNTLGEKGRQLVKEKYSWKTIALQTQELYGELTS